ncbi:MULTISPECIES: multiple monosaccharide ABC transporter permease [Leifsonia]|uniref:Xylose transport system permease protein XylH n=3 Tax=Leifsonia TaxID=110932 RepID=U2RP17_LEIAQ|nr:MULTISPECIES: multiple monosaccharide ABC transporter permease [Leifsonia]ERK70581.1 branched-chain amino acid ABC transporter, permease protein [Leifsonia aquatica ATCC 14665]MBB2967488.1 putative multiple sugar transport system permease protein [Leifsonia aquatica]NYK09741.1 putative multiple sugar transport system permease protein [Leifsonia naganoensis]
MTTQIPEKKKSGGIRDLGKMFGNGQSTGRQFGILGALVVIVVFFEIMTGGKTLDPVNLINLVNQNTYVLILAIGMVMVIIAGHIDLSVGSVAAVVGIVVAQAMTQWNMPWPLAVVLGLVLGAVIGAWQGWWVAYVGVPAFIVTLAGMLIFRGLNQFIGNANTIPVPDGFTYIGGGFLPEWGPDTGFNNSTLLLGLIIVIAIVLIEVRTRRNQTKMGSEKAPLWVSVFKVIVLGAVVIYFTFVFAGGRVGTSFPVAGVILGVLIILYSFVTRSTIFGRHIYAVGGNWHAAELSGVKIKRINFFVMMNMSVLAALAGMISVARSVSSGPQDGLGWELDAIAAVFIGGAAVSGGIGTVAGSIVGGLVIAVLNNGLQLLGVTTDKVQIIKGLVLLIAVGIDVYSKRRGGPSLIGRMFGGGKKQEADALGADQPAVAPSDDSAEASSRSLTN